ncbi:MAG: carboxypeptidase-like regulatory domain-containing protein, partial [Porphyromonas pasteri]
MGTQLRNLIVSLMLFIGSVTAVCAQTILVQGTVLDSRGTPLPKVSVTVKLDNSKHTTTDKEGKFSLQVPEKSVLVFTLTGKKTTEAPATTTPLEITLEDGEEQQKGSTVTTMRQTTSIQTKYYPLWVIDGVVYKQDSTFNTADLASTDAKRLIAAALPGLSERDIESFTVITDASATALYGNQATGGVISVRTRHAGQGINRFTYTSQLTYRFIPSYREFNILNSQDQMSVLKELEGGGSLSPETVLYQTRYGVYGLMYDNAIKYKNKEY